MGLKDLFKKKEKIPMAEIEEVKGIPHGNHWEAVVGADGLNDLDYRFRMKMERGMHQLHNLKWFGFNVQTKKRQFNTIHAVTSTDNDILDMLVIVNGSIFSAFPLSKIFSESPAFFSKALVWENGVEGWLSAQIPIAPKSRPDSAFLTFFDPTFSYHRGIIPSPGKVNLYAIGYKVEKSQGMKSIPIDDDTKERMGLEKNEITFDPNFSSIMPVGGPGRDDYRINMNVLEIDRIDMNGTIGYIFRGKIFGPESEFILPLIVRSDLIEGDVPGPGDNLRSVAWLVGIPDLTNVKPNGIPVKK